MKKNGLLISTLVLFMAILAAIAYAPPAESAELGKAAPAFTLTDTNGNEVSLSDYDGKYVVLEWLNYDCPFVRKHYSSGNMPGLQAEFTEKGVVWLSIVSSAQGKQGHMPPDKMNARTTDEGGRQSAVLLDPDGDVGRLYGAKTTPHMYIRNPEGMLIYMGGIDDKPSTKKSDIDGATNYVALALNEAMNGQSITHAQTRPYGCSVKY